MDPVRLLLADDDLLVLATLAKGLTSRGYQVEIAESGETALRLAQAHKFDLAILDIRMEGISGIATASKLLQDHDMHVLFLTAYTDQFQQAVDQGALGYLVKPVDIEQLVPAVEAALARARDLRTLEADRANLRTALASNRNISIAIGILIERRGLSEQGAFELLRARARSERRPIEEVARELVSGQLRLNEV